MKDKKKKTGTQCRNQGRGFQTSTRREVRRNFIDNEASPVGTIILKQSHSACAGQFDLVEVANNRTTFL